MKSTLLAFNRGLISRLAAARVDLKRMSLSAKKMVNWMPRVLGAMMLRPGLQYIGSTKNNAPAVHIPFVFAVDDTAIIELTSGMMRVRVNDSIITRAAVSTGIVNGTFDSNLTGWTDSDEAGATSSWLTGGYLSLVGNGTKEARVDQAVTVAGGDQNKEHALNITVTKGPIILKVGSTSGGGEYHNIVIHTGHHSIAFTPTGNFYVRLANSRRVVSLVDSISVAAGDLELPTPWTALQNIRFDQSADALFIASADIPQKRIERRGVRSWAIVDYVSEDGPWRIMNTDETITITPTEINGNITLTASKDVFRSTNVGGLYKLSSVGQYVEAVVGGGDQWTDYIRVTGVEQGRYFTIYNVGTYSGTIRLQRSVGSPGDWSDGPPFGTTGGWNYDDNLDNQIVYYRVGFKAGEYTSGSTTLRLTYSGGSIEGVMRITGYTSPTSVSADVLRTLGGMASSAKWSEGVWSARRGFPSAVALHDGRLWWAGKDKIIGSVSDAFNSFDETIEGDSGPISRSIGSGPVDRINWLLSANNLLIGGQGAEYVVRSSSLDEPVTPTNFGLKTISTLGSANCQAVKIDTSTVFINRNLSRAYEIAYDGQGFKSDDLTALVPEIGDSSFSRIAVQRQPDTRVHGVRGNGKVAVLVFDKTENVTCWLEVETDGYVEDVFVLPATYEDAVYYLVRRTIGGATKRYLEKFSLESQSVGGADCRLADSHIVYSGVSTAAISGLGHLEGKDVVVWGNSKDLGAYTVASGAITLSEAVTWCCVGLPYVAKFQSAKLNLSQAPPTNQRQKLDHVGLILADTHAQGLKYGSDFTTMDDLPLMEAHDLVDGDSVWESYEFDSVEMPGAWSTDSSLRLQAAAPRPCTVLAAVIDGSGHNK